MSRLRVPIGILVAYLFLVCVLFAPASAYGEEPAPPRKLVVTNTASWLTAFVGENPQPNPVTVTIADKVLSGIGVTWTIPPGGAVYAKGVASTMSSTEPFFLVPAPTNIYVWSVLSFDDEHTSSSFYLPPIGAVSAGHPSTIGPFVSQDPAPCNDVPMIDAALRCAKRISRGWIAMLCARFVAWQRAVLSPRAGRAGRKHAACRCFLPVARRIEYGNVLSNP